MFVFDKETQNERGEGPLNFIPFESILHHINKLYEVMILLTTETDITSDPLVLFFHHTHLDNSFCILD